VYADVHTLSDMIHLVDVGVEGYYKGNINLCIHNNIHFVNNITTKTKEKEKESMNEKSTDYLHK
ncbi:hypothetical protein, partial [Vibrio vulnificus]|uniref:hypothetical protein n=1 Tax=Vibrio vulnificus TaxID=672 RepID=UPI0019D4608B